MSHSLPETVKSCTPRLWGVAALAALVCSLLPCEMGFAYGGRIGAANQRAMDAIIDYVADACVARSPLRNPCLSKLRREELRALRVAELRSSSEPDKTVFTGFLANNPRIGIHFSLHSHNGALYVSGESETDHQALDQYEVMGVSDVDWSKVRSTPCKAEDNILARWHLPVLARFLAWRARVDWRMPAGTQVTVYAEPQSRWDTHLSVVVVTGPSANASLASFSPGNLEMRVNELFAFDTETGAWGPDYEGVEVDRSLAASIIYPLLARYPPTRRFRMGMLDFVYPTETAIIDLVVREGPIRDCISFGHSLDPGSIAHVEHKDGRGVLVPGWTVTALVP